MKAYAIFIFCISIIQSFAQYTAGNILGIKDGLPDANVWAVLKIDDGTIWFGTSKGVCWYDSYKMHFPTFDNDIPQINELFQDSKKNVWVLAYNGFYYCSPTIGNYHFKKVTGDDMSLSSYFYCVDEDQDGMLWLGDGTGLSRYSLAENSYKHFYLDKKDSLNSSLNRVLAIVADPDNTHLWLATMTKGLVRYNKFKNEISPCKNLQNTGSLSSLTSQGDTVLWIGSEDKGLFRYSLKTFEVEQYTEENSALGSNTILHLKIIDNEQLLIGTDGGGFSIVNVRDMQWQTYTHKNAEISNNKVWNVESDNQGNIWLGHYMGGVSMLSKQVRNFHTIIGSDTSRYLPFPLVTSILKDKNGFLWIANDENGLLKTRHNKLLKEYRNELKANFEYGFDAVISLFEDSEGTLWIGTYKGGVSFMKNGEFHNLKNDTANAASIPTNDIRAIAEDRNGSIWIATHGQGVCRLNKDRTEAELFLRTQLQEHRHLNSDWCWDMEVGPDNILWIGTSWGLEVFDIDNNKILSREVERNLNGYEFTWINSVDCLDDGSVIVTCRSGAFIYNHKNKQVKKITFPVLGFDPVSAVEDKNAIWFAGLKGIAKYMRDDSTCYIFNAQDGLQGDQFMKKSSFKDTDGYVYFGGTNGITYFRPDDIDINYRPPEIIFTQLQLMNEEVTIFSENSPLKTNINNQAQISFTHEQNIFKIDFAAQNYIQPQKNEYRYMLKGFDQTWQRCKFAPEAIYMNLEPGNYDLLVQASNNDKVWNKIGANLEIQVLPPWWNTIWFRIILFSSIILLLFGFYFYRIRSIKRINKLLELKVAERTFRISEQSQELQIQNDILQDQKEELTQINYTKDKFFSIIAHDLKNPMNAVIGFADLLNKSFDKYSEEKKKKFIALIAESSKNLLALLENLLQWSRSQSGHMAFEQKQVNINKLIYDTIGTLLHHAAKKNITLYYSPEKNNEAYADYNMINTVLRNLTSNAIKFTPQGGQICFYTSNEAEFVKVSIQDSGVGMDDEQLQALFRIDTNKSTKGTEAETGTGLGLILCKEFIDKHNGQIWAESSKGIGSTFHFTLPVAEAAQNSDH